MLSRCIVVSVSSCVFGVFLDCPSGNYQCNDGQCINATLRCDGTTTDCLDGSDESGCPFTCLPTTTTSEPTTCEYVSLGIDVMWSVN